MDIYLKKPKIENNTVIFSWEPNIGFLENSYWVEYPDFQKIKVSKEKLTEAYFPICLAFAAVGDVKVHLPWIISDSLIYKWEHAIYTIAERRYKTKCNLSIINGDMFKDEDQANKDRAKIALLFGGGSESLLALAHLLEKRVSPYIISLGGPSWPGSNPDVNFKKFELDKNIAKEFNLQLLKIRTNFKAIIAEQNWLPYMQKGNNMLFSVLYLPFFISFVLPISDQLSISRIINGNERESTNSFALWSSLLLRDISKGVQYNSDLHTLSKYEIVSTLHLQYPQIAKYQVSCFFNFHERWCHKCEKCFRNYIIYKINNIDLNNIEMDEAKILKNVKSLIWYIADNKNDTNLAEEWKGIFKYANSESTVKSVKKIYFRYLFACLVLKMKHIVFIFLKKYLPNLYGLLKRFKIWLKQLDRKRIVILGHPSCRNKGDEAVLKGILEGLNLVDSAGTVCILTNDYNYDKKFVKKRFKTLKVKLMSVYNKPLTIKVIDKVRRVLGLKEVYSWDIKDILDVKFKKLIRHADVVMISAKDLYTECYGQNAFIGWMEYLEFATYQNQNVYLWGGSFDSFNNSNEIRFKHALEKIKFITCRESESFDYLCGLINPKKCAVVPDSAFILESVESKYYTLHPKQNRRLGISISEGIVDYKNLDKKNYLTTFGEAICSLAKKYKLELMLIPHVRLQSKHNDFEFSRYLQKICSKNSIICELPPADLKSEEYKHMIGTCDFFIGTRTHTTIASLSFGIPTLAIAYSRKTYGIFQDFYGHTRYVLDVKGMVTDTIVNKFKNLVNEKNSLRNSLSQKARNTYREVIEGWKLIH